MAAKFTRLETVCHQLDTATEQLGEALQQVRALTDQRSAPPAPVWRGWWRAVSATFFVVLLEG